MSPPSPRSGLTSALWLLGGLAGMGALIVGMNQALKPAPKVDIATYCRQQTRMFIEDCEKDMVRRIVDEGRAQGIAETNRMLANRAAAEAAENQRAIDRIR